jgi:aldehyde dehydrogenase
MTQVNEQLIREMVEQVLQHVQSGWGGRTAPRAGGSAPVAVSAAPAPAVKVPSAGPAPAAEIGRYGQFTDVAAAVEAAQTAQRALARRSLAQREQACELIRNIIASRAGELGPMEYEETRIGHQPHKAEKLLLAAKAAMGVAGLKTACFSGDHGITLEEAGPWGVIGVATPVTHSLPTLAVNAVNMIAAGNSLVCNPHPGGKKVAAYGAKLFNQAIYEKLGIDNLVCVIVEPTLESAKQLFEHPDIPLLTVTGGPGVVAAALRSGKRAICAGPGNPPVVVDSSADMDNAARCILEGASYDNNLFCTSEKEVFAEAAIYDPLMDALQRAGACRLNAQQMDQLAKICIEAPSKGHPVAARKFVGAEPSVIAKEIGLNVPASCRLLYGPTDAMHPFVQAEQMMPVMPVVKCATFEEACDAAYQAEHQFGHTAVIHSRLVDHMTHFGKLINTTLFVKNGPSMAGNGVGGEGYTSYSIACSTGEGVTTPLTFTRFRRCVMVDNLRIV